jgi:predicted N-acetyltransferase YhbS
MMMIREEHASDRAAREDLLDCAFGPERHEKTCERLREGREAAQGLSFVAEMSGAIVGTVRLWNVRAGEIDALLLGPLAVASEHRSRGIGARLIRAALNRAASLGHKAMILVGDAPYYERFGFSASLVAGLDMPGPVDRARFLGLELVNGSLAGARGLVTAVEIADLLLSREVKVPIQPIRQAA